MSDECSFVVAFVDYLFISGYLFVYFDVATFRLSIDVYASSFLFYYLLYLLYSFSCCVMYYYGCGWPRSICLFPPDGVHIVYNYDFS